MIYDARNLTAAMDCYFRDLGPQVANALRTLLDRRGSHIDHEFNRLICEIAVDHGVAPSTLASASGSIDKFRRDFAYSGVATTLTGNIVATPEGAARARSAECIAALQSQPSDTVADLRCKLASLAAAAAEALDDLLWTTQPRYKISRDDPSQQKRDNAYTREQARAYELNWAATTASEATDLQSFQAAIKKRATEHRLLLKRIKEHDCKLAADEPFEGSYAEAVTFGQIEYPEGDTVAINGQLDALKQIS